MSEASPANRLLFVVERMSLADLSEVMQIEKVAFSAPWSARAYRYEVSQSDHSTMLVVRPAPRWTNPLGMGLQRLLGIQPSPVLGYAGAWHLVDEMHISTIAVHTGWQRRGLGELLLLSLLDHAAALGVRRVTLEVRVSNGAAQALYCKYGFEILSRQKAYYSDNNEDAFLMGTPDLDSPQFQANLRERRNNLCARLHAAGTRPPSRRR